MLENWQVEFESGERWPSPYYEDDRGGVRYRVKTDDVKQTSERPKKSQKGTPKRAATRPKAPKPMSRKSANTRGRKA